MRNILAYTSFVLSIISALGINANADDDFYGSTNSSSIELIDATTATVLSNAILVNAQTNNALGESLRIVSNGTTMFGLGTGGDLYTIDVSHTVHDVNNDVGYDVTQISSGIGAQNIVGLAFVSPTQLYFSTGTGLDQYNLSTHALSVLGSYANNTQISGLSFTPTGLLGMQYSPSPGGVDQIGTDESITQGGRLQGISQDAFLSLAMGQSGTLYVSNGSNELYSYNFSTESYDDLGHLNASGNVTAFVAVPELDRFTMINLGALAFLGSIALRRRSECIQC
jgi:hypothetical protein